MEISSYPWVTWTVVDKTTTQGKENKNNYHSLMNSLYR